MSKSLHAIKRFRLQELLAASPKTCIPPAAIASASNRPQRPLASTPLAAQPPQPPPTTTTLRSDSDVLATPPGGDGAAGAAGASIVLDNPFVPHKNPKSGRWAPPKYSLRRQAVLIKHARKSGTLHLLPPGPKMSEAQQAAAAAVPEEQEWEKWEEVVALANGLVGVRRGQGQEQEQGQGREEVEDGRGWGLDPRDAEAVASAVYAAATADDAWMTRSVEWVGKVRERAVAGVDVGNRLYAGKKRMFKGHKWERERGRRVARTKMLLRDMDKRVQRFKAVRTVSKPALPLLSSLFLVFFFSLLGLCRSLFLFADALTVFPSPYFFIVLVPCQGQAVAVGKKVQCVEEDAEAAVLTPRLTVLGMQSRFNPPTEFSYRATYRELRDTRNNVLNMILCVKRLSSVIPLESILQRVKRPCNDRRPPFHS